MLVLRRRSEEAETKGARGQIADSTNGKANHAKTAIEAFGTHIMALVSSVFHLFLNFRVSVNFRLGGELIH